ncbi:MAG: hypothetical protein ACKPKO_25200, partial [Candidatus Fonsibacter sp.]
MVFFATNAFIWYLTVCEPSLPMGWPGWVQSHPVVHVDPTLFLHCPYHCPCHWDLPFHLAFALPVPME